MGYDTIIHLTASDTPLPCLNQFVLDMEAQGYTYLNGEVTGLFTLGGGLMGAVLLRETPMYEIATDHVLVYWQGQGRMAYTVPTTGPVERRYSFVFGQTHSATTRTLFKPAV